MARNQLCTATLVMLNQLCTRTAKTRAIPSLHRDKFLAKVPESCPVRRRVTLTAHTSGPLGIIDNRDIIRFVMRKYHFLLAILFASMLSISGCKKEAPINIILYDKPLPTIKSYIHGKWSLVYGKGGICGTCVFPCNNCTVEFTTDDRFISKSFVVTTDTTRITWIKDVGMYLQGDSTYLMTFYAYPYFREAYVIDKIYFDTLIYYDNASDPMFYYCVKSK